jgi:hypothetical protein
LPPDLPCVARFLVLQSGRLVKPTVGRTLHHHKGVFEKHDPENAIQQQTKKRQEKHRKTADQGVSDDAHHRTYLQRVDKKTGQATPKRRKSRTGFGPKAILICHETYSPIDR